ncbi:DUF2703 domain-containing protein [Calothrix sp. FACHB-156]|nr:DUF2703 domain-containing protein [Calothrix sp. FACHB-156]
MTPQPQKTLNQFPRTLIVELLAIDLSTCSRCTGSLSNLEQAIATLQQVLALTGTVVQFHKILVESAQQAKQLRFVSSPTIRVNGRDIILDTTESRCGDCSDISGSAEGTACRTWSYQGTTHTEAPVGIIVDAIIREIDQDEVSPPIVPTAIEVPQNLQQFFQDKSKKAIACGAKSAVSCGCFCS